MEELKRLLREGMTEELYQIVVSGPRNREGAFKIKVRPVLLRDGLQFQLSRFLGSQVLHENLPAEETVRRLAEEMEGRFKQLEMETAGFTAVVLASKKGKLTVRRKDRPQQAPRKIELAHNRVKRYLLEEGQAVPYLVDLGVQTAEGKIVRSRYDKFR